MTEPLSRREVPCNGCRECCRHETVYVLPEMGDDPTRYHTREVRHPGTNMASLALAQKENGACIYLGVAGCTIHDRAPAICRKFDCKLLYERLVETFGMREVGAALTRSAPLRIGQKRARGDRP